MAVILVTLGNSTLGAFGWGWICCKSNWHLLHLSRPCWSHYCSHCHLLPMQKHLLISVLLIWETWASLSDSLQGFSWHWAECTNVQIEEVKLQMMTAIVTHGFRGLAEWPLTFDSSLLMLNSTYMSCMKRSDICLHHHTVVETVIMVKKVSLVPLPTVIFAIFNVQSLPFHVIWLALCQNIKLHSLPAHYVHIFCKILVI